MRFLTIQEFETIKVYELDNVTFTKALGERIGKMILARHLEKKLKDLTCQSYVDIMSIVKVL